MTQYCMDKYYILFLFFVGRITADYDSISWTRQTGTAQFDAARGMCAGTDGSAYVVGSAGNGLNGQLSKGIVMPCVIQYKNAASNMSCAGSHDIVLIKYDAAGTLKWTKQEGTSGSDAGMDVAVASDGSIYVVGLTAASLNGQAYAGGNLLLL